MQQPESPAEPAEWSALADLRHLQWQARGAEIALLRAYAGLTGAARVRPVAPPPSAGLGWTGLLTIAAMLLLLI